MGLNLQGLLEIANTFLIETPINQVEKFGNGLINNTYLASSESRKYILQKINTSVFRDYKTLVSNKILVTNFLLNKGLVVPEFYDSTENKGCYLSPTGEVWQLSRFINSSKTFNRMESPKLVTESGRIISEFHKHLSEIDIKKFGYTIPNFHNTVLRYNDFINTVNSDEIGKNKEALEEINFLRVYSCEILPLGELIQNGEIPLRITHNDTKLSNILFDENHNAICLVDLDTVMPGSVLHDVGDAMRSGANTASEEEQDLSKVKFDKEIFESFLGSYLNEAEVFLSDIEKRFLSDSPKLIIFEQAVRFLDDFLRGNKYYKVDYENHNLTRAKTQIKLLQTI